MDPEALVQLVLGLEPEAVALVTLLVKHLARNKAETAPPPATAVPAATSPTGPDVGEPLAATSLDPAVQAQ